MSKPNRSRARAVRGCPARSTRLGRPGRLGRPVGPGRGPGPRRPKPRRPWRGLLALSVLGLASVSGRAQGRLEALEGPAARAWALVDPAAAPARLTAEDAPPARDDGSGPGPWLVWAELLEAEVAARAAGRAPDARRRARLALIAASQGRSDDAWDHLAATTADPSWTAALAPHLAPGVPLDWLAHADYDPAAPLPDGLHFEPALPPPPVPAAEVVHGLSRVEPRELFVRGVALGAGVVDFRIALEVDGVQVDVVHVSGEPVTLQVTLPEPIDFEIRVEYLNWLRRDEVRTPIEVRVCADDPKAFCFGRFVPRRLPWGETLPDGSSARLERHGVQLRLPPGAEIPALESSAAPDTGLAGRLEGFAGALRSLFGWSAEVLAPDPGQPPAPWPGIVLEVGPGPALERKFTGLVSLVEHYALARADAAVEGE